MPFYTKKVPARVKMIYKLFTLYNDIATFHTEITQRFLDNKIEITHIVVC